MLIILFIFKGGRKGKEKGVVASFMLEPVNYGVGASFQLEMDNLVS
jgi:hypothetical protein